MHLDGIKLSFVHNEIKQTSEICLNGEDVAHQIHEMIVAERVSDVAALKSVREFAVQNNKELWERKKVL